jgi:hypothetical protein|tara:strand:+ start:242 stop:610 length:369 start_codon:yes stop_codon:yes gene_type:complete
LSYLVDRFKEAVAVLAGDGPIKQRLIDAYLEHLDDLENTELPAALRPIFNDLHAALHGVQPISREPSIKASVRKMSSVEATAHAGTIVTLLSELMRHGPRAEPLKVVSNEKKMTPIFLKRSG